MGYDYPEEMKGIQGNPCVTVWDDIMNACVSRYCAGEGNTTFDVPAELVEMDFCPISGLLPNAYCTDPVYGHVPERGWFVRGTEPQELCRAHREPPIILHPENPDDPERIPLLPNDLLPPSEIVPSEDKAELPWYVRWFSFIPDRKRRISSPFRS